jgi:hypothetical protein
MNPLLRRASRSSVFVFDFFHSRLESGRGGDIGGAAPVAATAASSRPLFFPAVFADLYGDGFILQVHDVFTRIRSGLLWQQRVAARSDLQRRRRALEATLAKIYSKMAIAVMGEKP